MLTKPEAAKRPAKTRNGEGERAPEAPRYIARDDNVGFLVWDARRAIAREFEKNISAHGVSLSTFWILRILWDGDGVTQAELVQKGRMRGPTIVGIIAQLEREGLITRVADAKDSRKKHIKLTPRGNKLRQVILPITEDVNKRALKGFTAAERAMLKDMLKRLRTNMIEP